ncbi:hypothetical protein QM996_01155 [Sinorhizobium chiapasense]
MIFTGHALAVGFGLRRYELPLKIGNLRFEFAVPVFGGLGFGDMLASIFRSGIVS